MTLSELLIIEDALETPESSSIKEEALRIVRRDKWFLTHNIVTGEPNDKGRTIEFIRKPSQCEELDRANRARARANVFGEDESD